MADLTCRQAELLSAEAEMGRATEADRMRLEVHLQSCGACSARTERLRSFAHALRDEPVEPTVPDRALVASAVMEAGGGEEEGRRLRLAPWAVAAAVLLAVAASAVWLSTGGQREAPVVEHDDGTAPTAPREPAPPAPDEPEPAALATAAAPCAGVVTETTDDARAFVTAAGATCRLRLDRGELRVYVDPEAGVDLAIVTPSARVRVVGTVFSVGVEDGYTSVVVYRGTVEVSDEAGSLRVTGGHRVDLGSDDDGAVVRAADPDALEPLEHMAREPRPEPPAPDRPARDTGGGPRPAGEGGGETTAGDEGPATGEPGELEPRPAEPPEDAEEDAEETSAPVADLRRLLRAGRPAEARAQASERVDRPEYARRRAELLTVIAESYAMERRWREAFDSYRRVTSARPGSATAANALLAAANIALDRLRDPAEAARLYETYLRQYPRGALHEDAFVGRCRALEAAGRHDAAASCARAYLATHPDGRFRDRARRLTE